MIGRVRARLRQRAAGDEGFTIIEAVVAITLLMVMSTVVLAAVLSTMRVADQVRSRTTATELATREVAQARALLAAGNLAVADLAVGDTQTNPTALDGGTTGDDLVVAGTSFTVQRTIGLAAGQGGRSLCGQGGTGSSTLNGTDGVLVRIEVSVTWSTRTTYQPVEVVELAPLPDSLSRTTSSVIAVVQVVDPTAGGAGVQGATVNISVKTSRQGYSLSAGTTDENGCVVKQLSVTEGATYTATATKAGYTSQSWTAKASSTFGALGYSSAVSWTTISYAPSGTLTVHLTNEDGTAAATDEEAADVGLTLLCSASGTTASDAGWTTTFRTATRAVSPVWPCTYTAYAGDDVPSSMTQVQVEPGQSVTIWVRPGYGIVPEPTGAVEPSPDATTAEPTDDDEDVDPDAEPDPAADGGTDGGTDDGTGSGDGTGTGGGTEQGTGDGTDAGTGEDPGSGGDVPSDAGTEAAAGVGG